MASPISRGVGLSDDPLNMRVDEGNTPSPSLDSHQFQSSTSSMMAQYNQRNPAVKRLMRESAEMASSDEGGDIQAQPIDDNLFEWHFTFRGAPESVYSNGIYHGRVLLPSQYPMSPPEIAILTPNGRFETGTKICLSISNYHPETWLPSWGIRTAITALRAFMSTDSPGAIGSMQCSDSVRKQMAVESLSYKCPVCGVIAADLLKQVNLTAPKAEGVAPECKLSVEKPEGNSIELELPKSENLPMPPDSALATADKQRNTTTPFQVASEDKPAVVGLPTDETSSAYPSVGSGEPSLMVMNNLSNPSGWRTPNEEEIMQFEERMDAIAARLHRVIPEPDLRYLRSTTNLLEADLEEDDQRWSTASNIAIVLIVVAVFFLAARAFFVRLM